MNHAINTCITGINSLGREFWNYTSVLFIQSSLLIVFLMILDFLLRKHLPAVFRYCLWMLLFIKLVLPASFTLPTGVGYWMGDYFTNKVSIAKFVPHSQDSLLFAAPQGHTPLDTSALNETTTAGISLEPICWQGLILLAWLVGVLLLSALLIQRVCFVKGLIAQSKPANKRFLDVLDDCRATIGIRQNIELRLTANSLSPAVCGLFKPVILMPADLLEKISQDELKAVLIHELAHIKRADIWVNLVQTIFQIVYFYNPLLWIANAMIRSAREQAVDEMVLVTLKPENNSYSNMLIDVAEMAFASPSFSLRLIGVVESKKALERRIKHMLNGPVPKSATLGILGLFIIVAIGAVLLPMGCNTDPENSELNTDRLIVPGIRIGEYSFDMSKDDVLEKLGKPKMIFYSDKRYTLDDLPRMYYMSFGGISFRILDDSVREITAHSPSYKFSNGLGVGDHERQIKQAFGDNFHIKKTKYKDFLSYNDIGIVFEINSKNRTVMEINVSPIESGNAHIPATSTINEQGHIVDKTDYPFVTDPEVIGGWKSVDFVSDIDQFEPARKLWNDELYLNHFVFKENGTIDGEMFKWTKGLVLGGDTASKYVIKEIDGSTYMFYEWKSADYTIRHDKPYYYVLRKVMAESLKLEPMFGKKAYIPPTSIINEKGHIIDKIDYPFVNDPQVIGTWESVDNVDEIDRFIVGKKQRKAGGGDLFLHQMIFEDNGRIISKNGNEPNGFPMTWTSGLVFYNNDQVTASKYLIKKIAGSTYMFYEWKSGDYSFRRSKPSYYVLRKV